MMNLDRNSDLSSLVRAALALDNYFSQLGRLGSKIESSEMVSDDDFAQMQNLMNHFSQSSEGISQEIMALSQALKEAQVKAEATAKVVTAKVAEFHNQQQMRQEKMEVFRQLGQKVQGLTSSLQELKQIDDRPVSLQEKQQMARRLSEIEPQLLSLIEEAQLLKTEAHRSKMKILEKGSHSLGQSLSAIHQKVSQYSESSGNLPS